MKSMRLMGPFISAVLLSQIVGCQGIGPVSPRGSLSFRFNAPVRLAAGPLNFSIKTIPAGTSRFEIEITGKGLDAPVKETIELKGGTSQSKTVNDLPVGEKQVTVKAMQDQDVLASASTQVTIEAGKVAQAELDLKALRALVTAQLEAALPLDLEVKYKISGEGLDDPQEKTVTIPANQTSIALGSVPLGSKQVNLQLSVSANGQKVSSPETDSAINVQSSGGKVNISASKVLASFSNDLESLLNQSNPLVVLAWVQNLRANPARLREFFFLLPAAARARLRQNPLIKDFLPPETDTGASPTPTDGLITVPGATPAPSASEEPAASPEPSVTIGLLADARLALTKPENPDALLLQPAQNVGGEIRILKANDTIQVGTRSAWGLLLRTSYSGFDQVSYQVAIRRATGTLATLATLNGVMTQRFKIGDENFSGDVLVFAGGKLVSLDAGLYDIKIDVKDPDTGKIEQNRYRLRVL